MRLGDLRTYRAEQPGGEQVHRTVGRLQRIERGQVAREHREITQELTHVGHTAPSAA
ncbi:hypothetical protein AB0G60_15655 [Streptomyces angustmyceticus]|uniref:hypothetical protein n=1 Tax=Streptomyces angustmyceticus TaxID=285578 RepID=UPI001CBCACA8|nr:hypothetical protein [Streptomyces angustmyceticus]